MDDYESNCIVLSSILGSCLSDINKIMPLWYYGIILPEVTEECCLSSLLALTIIELKQILESCGLITINNDIVKFVSSTSGYGGKYSWQIFLLNSSLLENYFAQMDLTKYKKHQKNVCYISLGNDRDSSINSSTQFKFKKPRKCAELNRLLNEKVNKMKSILLINNVLKNNNIEENDFSSVISFSTNEMLPTTTSYSIIINFIKNIISHNNIDENSTIERIIEYVKKIQMKEMEEKLFKLLDMRNSIKFNDNNDKLKINKFQKIRNHHLLSTLNIPFTCHTMSILLYEIVKLSQHFPKACILDIIHPQGNSFIVINNLKKVKVIMLILILILILSIVFYLLYVISISIMLIL